MYNDEREILNRNIICKKLKKEAQRSIYVYMLILILGSLLEGMMYLVLSSAGSERFGTLEKVEFIIGFGALVAICLFFLIRALLLISKAVRGEFTVLEESLTRVEEDRLSIFQTVLTGHPFSRANYNHIFRFDSGKTFVANCGEYQNTKIATAARFSLPGDKFFTVFYNDRPEKIILLFSAKTHNYKA